MAKYNIFQIKRYIEQIMMFPFVMLGHLAGLFPRKKNYDIYFFIPIYGVGGAEYVNALILDVLHKNKKIKLIFTKKSHQNAAFHLFEKPNIVIKDVSKFTDNKYLYFLNFFCRGYFATQILRNKNKNVLVFIGQCNFAYKLTPHLYRTRSVQDLIHGFDPRFHNVWMPFVSFLDKRMCISYKAIEQFNDYMSKVGVPDQYRDNFEKLTLFVDIPDSIIKPKRDESVLRVYYAGRNSPEKRLNLQFEIARSIKRLGLPVSFTFVGDLQEALPEDFNLFATSVPVVSAGADMYNFIKDYDVVILTSEREGLPIVVLEAMHFGIIPLVTPVGDMPYYLDNNNACVLDPTSETSIVESAVHHLKTLVQNPILIDKKSLLLKQTFKENFSKINFSEKIHQYFNNQKSHD